MKNLCIIPARGGSKRIPRKNIKDFLGMPIIAYSIKAAMESGVFDEVMVSTDDDEIAAISRQYGANIPFMRSAETSNDYATTADVINEVLDRYSVMGKEYDTVTCVYSTASFVTGKRIAEAMKKLCGDIDSIFTMVQYSYPPQRALHEVDGMVTMLYPEFKLSRSQDLEPIYHDAGQFYVSTVKSFKKANGFWGENTAGIILSELEVQDLDTPTDWALAEMKYKLLK